MKKYRIQKYIPSLLVAFVFIIIQVFCSTEIPKYLSNNINIGIMQQGVTQIYYKEMSKETYDMLLLRTNNNELIADSYVEKDGIYHIKDSTNIKELENITKKAFGNLSEENQKQIIAAEYKKIGSNNGIEYITANSLKMLSFALAGAFFSITSSFIISYTIARFAQKIRSMLFNKIENFSTDNLNNFGISSLLTRTTKDITTLQNSLNMILKISIMAPITLIIASTQAYIIAPELMKILVILSGILLVFIILAVILVTKKMELVQRLTDRINNVLREILTGKRVIRSFNKEKVETEKFFAVNKTLNDTNRFIYYVFSFMTPFVTFMISISSVVIIYYIAQIIPTTYIGLGSIFAFIQYAISIMVSFLMLTSILFVIPQAKVSFARIDAVLEEDVKIFNDENKKKLDRIETLEFRDVCFAYDNSEDKILKNVSFKIGRGQTLGVIGGTGSGKSSITKLILRFVDATAGSVLLNDEDIKDFNLFSLRNNIAYTPQSSKVFSGTVLSNITYGSKNIDRKKAEEAIKIACAEEFANLDREINQAGANLSGGQKQRIQIARSIYKNADILIFDDSFSALDNNTDKKIRDNLDKINNMKIIISQKISTIKNADYILVLNEGSVVGLGTHDELINDCEIYKELVNTQAGGALE